MSDLVITRSSSLNSGFQKRLIPATIEIGPYMLIVSLIVFIALMSVTTLMFSTKEVTKGYRLKDLEGKRNVLVKEQETKQMHLAEVQSLDVIRASAKLQTMRKPGEIVYLRSDSSLALK